MTPPTNKNAESSQEWAQLGGRLKQVREYLGHSQQYVSERTGIQRSAISDVERGTRRVDGLELKKLARLYRYPVAYFLDEDEAAVPGEYAVGALARALTGLTQGDRDQVLKFAEFLRFQNDPTLRERDGGTSGDGSTTSDSASKDGHNAVAGG